jgi:hypothetical protein
VLDERSKRPAFGALDRYETIGEIGAAIDAAPACIDREPP